MAELHHEIRIAAAPQQVWAALADLEAVQHYNPSVLKARCTTPVREGVGAQRHCDLKPKGWVTERVTAWEPGRALAMELLESQWPLTYMRWRTEIAPDAAGTLLSQRLDYQVKFGPLGALLDKLVMRRQLDRALTQVFAQLKQFVETGARAS
jgi:uncharacterized protein YndB with AHSA1/START domain